MIRLERRGAVATLVLARPQMGNALVPEFLEALLARLREVSADRDLRVLVLAAEGEVFSLGGDMRRFQREYAQDIEAYSTRLVGLLNETILALIDLPQIVVAAVHGHVTGGSLGLVLASDLVVLAEAAVFKAHYVSAGFAPDGGWTAILPRRIGASRVAACLYANRAIRAEEALALGLVCELRPGLAVRAGAQALAGRIAAAPAGTLVSAKRLLAADRPAIAAALEAERVAFVGQVAAARVGVDQFLKNFATYPDGE
ncbi:2-(1,2-epoxy-1,2-dihydrophenyl)acetyl-CoA isomerase [Burkholderiales bacterium]|nr:2-(1,2-epoxy-1,2-dihydrophenyl)acetyl-CoA isomerase [Burkholderiales bacterium]